MQVQREKIVACLKRVEEVREYLKQYALAPVGLVLNLADLHHAIQDLSGVTVTVSEVVFSGKHLRGTTERYQVGPVKTAKIYVRAQQVDEEKRLAVTKELCHILIDCEGDWSTDGVGTIRGLLQDFKLSRDNGIGNEDPSDPLVSEVLAHVAAVELLYPDEYRAGDLQKLAERQKTIAQIGIEHEIPGHAVEQALDLQIDLEGIWKEVREG